MKTCSRCKAERPLTEFYVDKRASDGHRNACKPCHRATSKAWYISSHEENKDKRRQRRRELVAEVYEQLASLKDAPCADCGERFPSICMDFDHVQGVKIANVSRMVNTRMPLDKILAEIAKCDVVRELPPNSYSDSSRMAQLARQDNLMATSRINVRFSGPLFDDREQGIVRDWLEATKREVADMGVRELDAVVMDKTGRGTGHYQSQLTTYARSGDMVITDPVVYGPWLEGTSRRNDSTRFKGYHLWRRTRLRLRRTYKDVAEKKLQEYYLERMGGRP